VALPSHGGHEGPTMERARQLVGTGEPRKGGERGRADRQLQMNESRVLCTSHTILTPSCFHVKEFPKESTHNAPYPDLASLCCPHLEGPDLRSRDLRPAVTSLTAATVPPRPCPPELLGWPRTPLTQPGRPRRCRQACRVHPLPPPPPPPPQQRFGTCLPGSRSHAPQMTTSQ
jgi:hypothetical protein